MSSLFIISNVQGDPYGLALLLYVVRNNVDIFALSTCVVLCVCNDVNDCELSILCLFLLQEKYLGALLSLPQTKKTKNHQIFVKKTLCISEWVGYFMTRILCLNFSYFTLAKN
jgi:hypothetical protein